MMWRSIILIVHLLQFYPLFYVCSLMLALTQAETCSWIHDTIWNIHYILAFDGWLLVLSSYNGIMWWVTLKPISSSHMF